MFFNETFKLVGHKVRELTSSSIKRKACYEPSGHNPRLKGPVNVGYGNRSPHHSANSTHIKEVVCTSLPSYQSCLKTHKDKQTGEQETKTHTQNYNELH